MTEIPEPAEPAEPAEAASAESVLAEPVPKKSRAGRNLPAAIGVGAFLGIGLVLIPIYFAPTVFIGVVLAAALVAQRELQLALASRDIRVPILPLVAGTAGMVVAAHQADLPGLLVAYLLTAVLLVVWRLTGPVEGYLRDTAAAMFAATYVSLFISFAVLVIDQPQGADRVLAIVLTAVCSDIGGYVAGVLFGKHPMAPRISPKKSWEGFAGSVALCVASGIATGMLLLDLPWWQGAALGLAMVATAVLGDLAESAMKRDLGIKDMGNLLPGHGGLIDRLDSLLLSAPVGWLVLTVFMG